MDRYAVAAAAKLMREQTTKNEHRNNSQAQQKKVAFISFYDWTNKQACMSVFVSVKTIVCVLFGSVPFRSCEPQYAVIAIYAQDIMLHGK